jgi:hypothetical protein
LRASGFRSQDKKKGESNAINQSKYKEPRCEKSPTGEGELAHDQIALPLYIDWLQCSRSVDIYMLQSLPEMTINYGVVQSTPHPSLRDPCKR